MKRILFLGAALLATGATIALAQPAPPRGDGTTSIADMRQREAERFTALDTNKDGQLSLDELKAGRPQMGEFGMRGPRGRYAMGAQGPGEPDGRSGGPGGGPGRMMRGADANNDGVITQDEFIAEAAKHFQQLDANHDGKIAGDEARPPRGPMGAMGDRRMGRMGGMGDREQMAERRFAMLDADHNGSVSRAEFDRPLAERIARLDANHDGKVTPEERRAGRGRPAQP